MRGLGYVEMSALSPKSRRVGVTLLALVVAPGCAAFGGSGETTPGAKTTDIGGTTPTQETTETTTAKTSTASDGHDHGGSNESNDSSGDAAATGEMSVGGGDTELEMVGGSKADGFWFDGNEYHVWHRGESDVTLARALSTVGVEATAKALTYDGTTYEESADGTRLYYSVNGEPVNPAECTLKDGDEVWVTVETPAMNRDVPGDHVEITVKREKR